MKTLSNLAEGQVFQSAKKRVKAMGANKTVLWNLHAAPSVQILSIRALESKIFNNSDDDDSMLAAQVLVKIDTLQVSSRTFYTRSSIANSSSIESACF